MKGAVITNSRSLRFLALGFVLCVVVAGGAAPAYAKKLPKEVKRVENGFGIAMVVGAPHLISAEFRYVNLFGFSFGLGYGVLPINSFVQRLYQPSPVEIEAGFVLSPSLTYNLSSLSAFGRYEFLGLGLFIQLAYHSLSAQSDVVGSLTQTSLGLTFDNAMNGTISITQPMIALQMGYQLRIGHTFIEAGAGGAYLLRASQSISLTQNFPAELNISSTAADNAQSDAQTALEEGITQFQAQYRFAPTLWVAFGYEF